MCSSADDATVQASAAVRSALRELAANLMRVTRGAGRPDLILPQTTALNASLAAYHGVCGEYPSAEHVAKALKLEVVAGSAEDIDDIWPDWDRAVREMVNGALQVAAAELLAQRPQAAAGRRELFTGYRHIEKLHTRQLRRLLRRRSNETEGEAASGGGG